MCILKYTGRIAESAEADRDPTADYTGQIRQFSEIGPRGVGTTPRPWVCFLENNLINSTVIWQTPDGSVVPQEPVGFVQATGSQLYQSPVVSLKLGLISGQALSRGPDYISPSGEYCCNITTVPNQRRCVTLSEY